MPRLVLLSVIDCLRADHVSAYGYARETTPTLDEVARGGVLWRHAQAASSWTKPSVASLLTGAYPSQHGAFQGVKRNGRGRAVTTDAISAETPTLAERFSQAGWRCGAFINNAQLDEFTGLHRGFETYQPRAGKADRILASLEQWLRADADRPAFAYLHFLEAHWPYKPRRRHIAQFGGDRDTNVFSRYSARDFGRLRREVARGEATLSAEELKQMIQMYDGAVRRLDGKLKRVLRMLEGLGLRDETALFVTADHGEEFLEHGRIGHGHDLAQEVIHVPLVASIPGLPRPEIRCEPVGHVDLGTTMLHTAGIADSDEPNLLNGVDSLRPVVSELRIRRRYTQALRRGKWKLQRRYAFECDDADALRNTPHELARTMPYKLECELYDLDADPAEQRNLAGQTSAQAPLAELTASLDRWWDATAAKQSGTCEIEIDKDVVERLRALGYMD